MTRDAQAPLDSFESSLLAQLKREIDEGGRPAAANVVPSRHRYAVLVLAVAAITAVAVLAHALWPTPAFAVTGRNGTEVTVKVMRLEGADQLEQALRDRGIPADITYLPTGKQCAPGRYEAVRTPGLRLAVSADWFKVTIPPNAVGPGDTFVLSASVVPFDNGFEATVEFDIAYGPIKTCHAIDAP